MFNINFDILIKLLLPVSLRQPTTESFLKAVLKPLKQLYNIFLSYRTKQLLALSYTGQTMYLKKLLNDNFDNARRFRITDVANNRLQLCNDPNVTKHLTPAADTYEIDFYNPEHDGNNIDFTITGADDLLYMPSITEVAYFVDRYKLAGKKYNIEFIHIDIS